jgi:hypothetical protein
VEQGKLGDVQESATNGPQTCDEIPQPAEEDAQTEDPGEETNRKTEIGE